MNILCLGQSVRSFALVNNKNYRDFCDSIFPSFSILIELCSPCCSDIYLSSRTKQGGKYRAHLILGITAFSSVSWEEGIASDCFPLQQKFSLLARLCSTGVMSLWCGRTDNHQVSSMSCNEQNLPFHLHIPFHSCTQLNFFFLFSAAEVIFCRCKKEPFIFSILRKKLEKICFLYWKAIFCF